MRRYNTVSRILLILTTITFALAAPAQVQEKRQAPEDVIAVLGKRTRDQDLDMLWDGLRYYENVWGPRVRPVHPQEPPPLPDVPPPNVAEVPVPPPNPAAVAAPNPAGVHVPPQGPADPNRELMELDDDAPPGSPASGHSDTAPTSPVSTKSDDWYTAPSNEGSPTGSDSDSERWSTISNAPSAESQSENLRTADNEMRGKATVLRRISGIGIDMVDAAQMELRSADTVP
jgi:hypothetical protein